MNTIALKEAVVNKLQTVIDPETNVDVVRMRLVNNLEFDENGKATYTFRPSSPLCPIAVPLAMMIIKAIGEVDGITSQTITVIDYVEADKLNEMLKDFLEEYPD